MAKQGMKRPQRTHVKPKNDVPPVPEIQGKAKHGHVAANPVVANTVAPSQKVYHARPHSKERAAYAAYSVFDSDVAIDNLANDLSAADLQDM